jgi:hypothetical protein
MKNTACVLFILIPVLASVATCEAISQDDPGAVYEATLELLSSEGDGLLLVLDPTAQVQRLKAEMAGNPRFAKAFPTVSTERLITLNQTQVSLRPFVRDNARWVLLSEDQQKALRFGAPDSEEVVRKAYPNAGRLVKISRASFDVGTDRALIYMKVCGNCDHPCDGSGHLVALRRARGGWIVQFGGILWRAHW